MSFYTCFDWFKKLRLFINVQNLKINVVLKALRVVVIRWFSLNEAPLGLFKFTSDYLPYFEKIDIFWKNRYIFQYTGYTVCTTWLRLFLHEPNKNCDQSLIMTIYHCRHVHRGCDETIELYMDPTLRDQQPEYVCITCKNGPEVSVDIFSSSADQMDFMTIFYTKPLTWYLRAIIQLPMQSVPITTDVVSSNLDQGEVYNIMW